MYICTIQNNNELTWCQTLAGTGIGCSFALLLTNFAFIRWHLSQFCTNCLISSFMFRQKKRDVIFSTVLSLPRWLPTTETQKEYVDSHDLATAKINLVTNYTCNSRMAWFKDACFFLFWSHTDALLIFFLLVSTILPVMQHAIFYLEIVSTFSSQIRLLRLWKSVGVRTS